MNAERLAKNFLSRDLDSETLEAASNVFGVYQSQNDRLVRALESLLAMHDDQMFICGQDDCGTVNKNLRAAKALLTEIKKGQG